MLTPIARKMQIRFPARYPAGTSGEDKIIMMRSGPSQAHLVMENQRRCIGEYGVDGRRFTIGVTTEEIQNKLDESGGTLFFRYLLDLNAQSLSTNEVTITVQGQ